MVILVEEEGVGYISGGGGGGVILVEEEGVGLY